MRADARPWLWALALLVGLSFLWAPLAALGEEAFWAHDLRHHHLPWRAWSAARWADGALPLWAPEVGNGFPLMADGQTGVFYPPTQLLFLLLPDPLALNLSLLGHIVLAGLGARALARAVGRSELASVLAGVAYAFSGFMATHALYLGFQNVAAWVPWVAWAVLRRRHGLLGLFAAMMLVAGHPQAAALGLLLAGALALLEARREGRQAARRLGAFTAAMVLAGMVAAPQLLASAELVGFTLRDGGLPADLASQGSLPPQELLNGVLPKFFGFERPADIPETYYHRGSGYWGQGENHWEMAFYLGVPVVLLALLGLREGRRWGLIAALALLLMLGSRTPLWPLLRHLPGLEGFRFPVRFSLILTLAVALLAAFGLDGILAMRAEEARRLGRRTLASAGALLLLMGIAHGGVSLIAAPLEARLLARAGRPLPPPPPLPALQLAAMPPPEERDLEQQEERVEAVIAGLLRATRPWGPDALLPAGLLVAMGAGCVSLGRGRLSGRAFAGGVLGLVVLDLFAFGRGYQATAPVAQVDAEPAALGPIRAEGGRGRATVLDRRQDPALDTALISASLGLRWGTRDVILPSPLRIVRQEALLSRVGLDVGDKGAIKVQRLLENLPLVDLLGVRWITTVHTIEHPDWTLVQDGPARLYRNARAMPAAFLVACARQLGAEDADAAWAALSGLDPRREAILEGAPVTGLGAGEGCPDTAELGSAEILVDEPERMVIRVRASGPALLVQTDTWYPGWEARLDGAPVEIRRADFLFRGVPVPAGEHELVLEYKPEWITTGLLCFLFGSLALLGWAGVRAQGVQA